MPRWVACTLIAAGCASLPSRAPLDPCLRAHYHGRRGVTYTLGGAPIASTTTPLRDDFHSQAELVRAQNYAEIALPLGIVGLAFAVTGGLVWTEDSHADRAEIGGALVGVGAAAAIAGLAVRFVSAAHHARAIDLYNEGAEREGKCPAE